MRHRHRYAVHRHREVDTERLDQPDDGLAHPLPLVVRLGAGEQEERCAGPVDDPVQQHRRVVVGGPAVLVEGHRRAPPAVVQQLVDVEGGDHPGDVVFEQVRREQPLGAPGVDETAERGNEHPGPGLARVGVVLESIERGRVLHVPILPSADAASTPRVGIAFRRARECAPASRLHAHRHVTGTALVLGWVRHTSRPA